MCANCKTSEYCDCAGGGSLAVCSCQTGERCTVCGHEAEVHVAADPSALTEVAGPALVVDYYTED
jgi:uncharacterized protein (DUF983 family)